MRINKLLIVIAACLMVTSAFAALQVFAVQPPLVTDTYYIGTIGQPRRLDPARAYDTASGDVIMNVYEPLVFFNDKDLIPEPTPPSRSSDISNPALWADLSSFDPILCTEVPSVGNGRITDGGLTWRFTINENAQFTSWIKADGSTYPATNLTARDVEYSLERILVQDMPSPSWMYSMPLMGTMWNFAPYGALDLTSPTDRATMAAAFDGFVTTSGNDVTLHFGYSWPETAIMQILSQTWGGIGQEAFCVEHGCWNGSYYDAGTGTDLNWAQDYVRKPSASYGPLDRWYYKSKYTNDAAGNKNGWGNGDVPAAIGTGPYKFTSWDRVNKIWRMDWNPGYWRFWADAGNGAGNFLKTIIERGVDVWPTRKMMFLEGEFDNCAVPRANMYDLLASGDYEPIEGIKLFYGHAGLANEMAPFTLDVADASPYDSKILGITCNDFFGNQYVRSAFTWALNYTDYLANAWFGEAIQQDSWWVDGLQPASFKNTALVHKNYDAAMMESELDKAFFPAVSNTSSVWDLGFETYLVYNIGNDQRKIVCEMIQSAFQALGARFDITVVGIDWPTFLDYQEESFLGMYYVGWLADFADPDNFARPYMHTYGDFSYFQGYSNATVDALIDAAILMPNNATREYNYKELQAEYYRAGVGLPICQATGRRWVREWVKGWYYNQLYPGGYYYDQVYKETGTLEPIDIDVTGTITRVTFYPEVYWVAGAGLIGNGDPNYAIYHWQVHLERNDADAPAFVFTAVGMRRYTGGAVEYCNATTVSLAQGGEATVDLYWYEDGSMAANFASNVIWNMTAVANAITINVNDTNTANNELNDNLGMIGLEPLTGDIVVDGIVDIFDAIQLSNAFGSSEGDVNWNGAANLSPSDPETIDIFDAILLANNFSQHIP